AVALGCHAWRPELDPKEHLRGEHTRLVQEPFERLWPAVLHGLEEEGLRVAEADRARGAIATRPVRFAGADLQKKLAEIADLSRARREGMGRVSELDVTYYLLLAPADRGRQVVFVPYAAPEDRVQAEVVERHGGYLRARVAAVLAAGPDRVLPGCRYFPTCGGCQWQHVAPRAQRDAKAAIVAEQLARVAGVRDAEVLPTVPSPADWHYRARITLAVEGRRVGYRRARSPDLGQITDCPPADPVVSAHLEAARAWVAALRVPLRRVTVSAAPGGVVLAASATARPGPADLCANAARLGLAAATFRADDVARALAGPLPGPLDAVVLDPPRTGAADAVFALAVLRPPRIVYVSCDPATLARDVRALLGAGYRLDRVQPIDVFPQTYHVESVVTLRLT